MIIREALENNVNKSDLKNKYFAFIASHSSDRIYTAFIDFCDNEETSVTHLVNTIRGELKLTTKRNRKI